MSSGAVAPAAGQPAKRRKYIPFGRYLLLDRIAVGGMAEVYRAKAFGVEGFERIIAIKRMLPSMAEDEEFVSMFVDEAKIVARLHHASIVTIYELGRIGESHFIAMEYVWGKDLLQIMNRFRKKRSFMPSPMAAFIAARLCEGLDHAHRSAGADGVPLNIVHRDVSPQNILISYEGEVKLVDFGIATARQRLTRTQAGVLKGKFGYMSPEQARGDPLDRRSDVFAVGTCLWEMLTLERLFVADSEYHTLEKIRNVDIDRPSKLNPSIDPKLESIVLKALTQDREKRWQWAGDLADALQRYLVGCRPIFNANKLAAWVKENFSQEIRSERARMQEELEGSRGVASPPTIPPSARMLPPTSPQAEPTPAVPAIHDQQTVVTPSAAERRVDALMDGTAVFYSNEAALLEAPILNIESPPTPSGARLEPPPPPTPAGARRAPPPPPPIPSPPTPGRVSVTGARAARPSGTDVRSPAEEAPARGESKAPFVIAALLVTVVVFGGLAAWYYLHGRPGPAAGPRVFVTSAPVPTVAVRVDGVPVGQTPLLVAGVAPGSHSIEAEGPGGTVRREFTVGTTDTQVLVLPFGLPVAPIRIPEAHPAAPGRLLLDVRQPGASVVVDDSPLAADRIGVEIPLAAGTHRIRVSLEGFVTQERTVEVASDATARLTVDLTPVRGTIVVTTSPAGAEVTVDGRIRGRTPLRLEGLDFDRYRVGVRLEGHRPAYRRALLTRREPSADIDLTLEPE